MATTNSWSATLTAKLKFLFDKGLSTAEIGKRLGFTKNAIVGKINRLGLNEKKPAAKAAAKKTAAKPAPKPIIKKAAPIKKPTKQEAKATEAGARVRAERLMRQSAALMALKADQCRWPMGNPDTDDFKFCGEKCFAGKPYCFEHCKLAYQFTQPRKR
ncbi:MAG: GcrA family cell cycle regulator [Rickettsiales bacterium]|jgi:GcrA cell cycle regulator|nr:GcrA family cell cycle regulator [Rickettsiales bacterium]